MSQEILVIGAGPAGLTAAYYLERAKLPYRVVDRAPVIGSTWANLYPSLRLNTVNFYSTMPGMRTPWRAGFYMSGQDFYRHLTQYAQHHHFNVHLNVTVTRVTPENGGWRVESSEGIEWFPAVIIATGKFGNPYLPPIPGMEAFQGELLHANDFHDPTDFADKRVIVVGSGPSGSDIAIAIGEVSQHPVLLAVRSDVILARRFPYGLPHAVWKILLKPLPEKIREPLVNAIAYTGFRNAEQYGLKLAFDRKNRQGTGAPVRGPELLRAIRLGQVKPVAGLARLHDHCAVLMDGSEYPADTVIMSTGYHPVVDYLDIEFETDADGWPVRDPGQQVAGYPGLYIVGRFYQGFGPLHNMKAESEITVQQIQTRLATMGEKKPSPLHHNEGI